MISFVVWWSDSEISSARMVSRLRNTISQLSILTSIDINNILISLSLLDKASVNILIWIRLLSKKRIKWEWSNYSIRISIELSHVDILNKTTRWGVTMNWEGESYMYNEVNLLRHAKSKREVSKKDMCQRDARYARNNLCEIKRLL